MLKIDGQRIIEMGEKPGPRIGQVLHALLEEVLDDPRKNLEAYLEERTLQLLSLPGPELERLGAAGKDRKQEEDSAAVAELRKKHHVN
jgi:hypothetical protein